MELSENIINNCQQRALSQVLNDWGSLSYEAVIESLKDDGYTYPTHPDIVVWLPFEGQWSEFLAEEIENLCTSFKELAREVIEEVKG